MNSVVIKKWLSSLWPIFFLLAFCLAVFAKVILFHKTTFYTNLDNVDQFYSWYQKLASSIHRGYLPLWDANTFSGHSFVGEFQTGVFYPINLLFCWLFGTRDGIALKYLELIVALHFLIASIGMYLFSREIKLGKLASLGAALIFAYSGAIGSRAVSQTAIFFGLSLIPLAVYFTARYINTNKNYNLIFTGFTLGLIILAGHIQPMFHGFIIITAFLIFRDWDNKKNIWQLSKKLALNLAMIILSMVAVALPQLILSQQYMKNAYRWVNYFASPNEKLSYATYAKAFNIDLHEFANIINPWNYPIRDGNNIFIGLGSLAFIIIGLITFKGFYKAKEWQENKFFIYFILIFSLLAALGYWTFIAAVLYKLPFVYQVRQLGRYVIMLHFALATLIGLLINYISEQSFQISKSNRKILFAISAFSLVNFIYLYLLKGRIFNLNFALQWLAVACIAGSITLLYYRKKKLVIVILLILATNSYLNTRWFLPVIQLDTKLPSYIKHNSAISFLENEYGKYRVQVLENALPANIGDVYNIQTQWGYGATVYKPYLDFIKDKPYDSKEYDLLGVKYVVTKSPKAELRLLQFDPTDSIYLYERNDYYPKLFTKTDLNNGLSGRQIAALDRFSVEKYNDMDQIYKITLTQSDNIIFSEINYPGWKAYIDGQPTKIETANISGISPLFKAISVPAGAHTVQLKYIF